MFRKKSKSSLKDEEAVKGKPAVSPGAAEKTTESSYRVVVAIDFGTTYSGYAYASRRKPDEIHLMRRREAGLVGAPSHKIPTILLLDGREQFYAFGYDAREAYHDMSEEESRKWLYFEKFKMELHSRKVQMYIAQ